jgi:LacI family repressor for deo operon, udp, cdd, tsx, nupC, and nupG
MASIQDVAMKAGVSVTTVSRTFCAPSKINPVTHTRVVEAARQLGYQPRGSRQPKAPPSRPTGEAIGFQFFADRVEDGLQSNMFYAPMLYGAQAEAADLGLNILVNTADRHSVIRELPRMILDGAISGLLLTGAVADAASLALFARHVPNLVLLDQYDDQRRFESVHSDGFDGAYQATNYLLRLGHRRIAFFLSEESTHTFEDRCNGYIAALFQAGITPEQGLVVRGRFDDTDDARLERIAALLSGPNPPTALICPNDDYAFSVMRILRKLQVRVPDDLSLIGFDDIPFGEQTDPPLTTVRVDKELMGRLAVRRLYAQITGRRTEHPEPCGRYAIPVTLRIRESCRAL